MAVDKTGSDRTAPIGPQCNEGRKDLRFVGGRGGERQLPGARNFRPTLRVNDRGEAAFRSDMPHRARLWSSRTCAQGDLHWLVETSTERMRVTMSGLLSSPERQGSRLPSPSPRRKARCTWLLMRYRGAAIRRPGGKPRNHAPTDKAVHRRTKAVPQTQARCTQAFDLGKAGCRHSPRPQGPAG